MLTADAYEQMGYQVEGPQWRYIYLTAARELRDGVVPQTFSTVSQDTVLSMPLDILFDFAAIHLDGEKAADAKLRIDFVFTDQDQTWTVWIQHGVLNARRNPSEDAQLTVSGPKAALIGVVLNPTAAEKLAAAGTITLDGDTTALTALAELMDDFHPNFNVVSP